VDGTVVERALFLVPGHTTVVVEWRLLAGPKCWIEARPFFACRPMAELRRAGPLPPVMPKVQHSEARVFADGYWYFDFEYDTGREDLFSPAVYQFRLTDEHPAWAVVSAEALGDVTAEQVAGWRQARRARGFAPLRDFVTGVGEMRSGYPWPGTSLEDALIALPEEESETRRVLERAFRTERPSLWLFPALMEYQRRAGEDEFLAESPCGRVIDEWMALCDGETGLLRDASAAENALWINALLVESMLAGAFGWPRRAPAALRRALACYEERYWPGGRVTSMEASQILAVSLPFAVVEEPLQREIVAAVGMSPVGETWLLRHYLAAYLRVHGYSAEAGAYCRREFARVEARRLEGCLGHLPMGTQAASLVRLAEHLRIGELLAGL